ncbi:MAG: invasion associated locus B family protein [Pseudomonadota bacterium]
MNQNSSFIAASLLASLLMGCGPTTTRQTLEQNLEKRWTLICTDLGCRATFFIKDLNAPVAWQILVENEETDQRLAAGATIQLPPTTNKEDGLAWTIGNKVNRYPLAICLEDYCVVRAGLTENDLKQISRVGTMQMTFSDNASGQKKKRVWSLRTEGLLDALKGADAVKQARSSE